MLHFMKNRGSTTTFIVLGLCRSGRSFRLALAGLFFLYCTGLLMLSLDSGSRSVHTGAAYFVPMANFDISQRFVHTAEGGFQIDPRDRGNWSTGKIGQGVLAGTNFGISAAFLSGYWDRQVTRQDMESLTYEQALEIYKTKFWDSLRLGRVMDQELATLIYDCAVNQGVTTARLAIRHAILNGGGPKLTSHPVTSHLIDIINLMDARVVHELIWEYRRERYNPASPFYKGWMKRLDKLKRLG